MDILDARVSHARRLDEFAMVEAVVTLNVRDTLRPNPYEMTVLSFAPYHLANRPGALRRHLIHNAINAS